MRKGAWIAAAVLTLAAEAGLAEAPRVYLTAGLGVGYAGNGSLGEVNGEVDFDLARPIANMALGLATRGGWRFELEGGYRYNDAEVVFFDDGSADLPPDSDSRITALSAGINAIYEFDPGIGVRPYLGVGLAHTRIDYELTEYITGNRLLDDDDSTYAYQLLAGVVLPLPANLDLLLDYRYWRAPDIGLETVDEVAFETAHEAHSANLSLRYVPAGRASANQYAVAERSPGWYVHGRGGTSFAKDAEIKNNIANFDAFDVGPVFVLAAGRTLGQRWRVEVEAAHRSHEAELIDFNPEFGEDRAEGDVTARSLMTSVIYEPTWNVPFRPYAGLGLGMAWSTWDVRLQADDSTYVDDEDSAAAFQVMFGASAQMSSNMEITAEFRYWMTGLFDLQEPDGRPMRTELTVNSLVLGVRYTLP